MTHDSSISLNADITAKIMKTPSKRSVSLIRQFARTYTFINNGSLSTLILN